MPGSLMMTFPTDISSLLDVAILEQTNNFNHPLALTRGHSHDPSLAQSYTKESGSVGNF